MTQHPRGTQRGMTLIELMVAMGLTLVAAAASYTLFVGQSRLMKQTQSTVEMQDNARIAMEMLTRDIRNAGFMVPPSIAIQIEDKCGETTNDVNYTSATNLFSLPPSGGTAVIADGDLLGTTGPSESCPNGSDRLTLVSRPKLDFAQGAGGPGNSLQLDVNCPGNAGTYNCALIFTNGGITGTTCGSVAKSDPITMCSVSDPFSCEQVIVEPHSGQCSSCTAAVCTLKVYSVPPASGSPFQSDSDWDDVGGKLGAGFQAWQYRIYQIMDLDGDGSTELVFSDDAHAKLDAGAAGASAATWNVIANNIDDLQVAYALTSAPLSFINNRSMLIYPGCAPAYAGTAPGGGGYDCGTEVNVDEGDIPVGAVRVSIVARSPTKVQSPSGGFAKFTRDGVENNAPVATTSTCATCSGNGNEEGFTRRVLTQAVTTRNTK